MSNMSTAAPVRSAFVVKPFGSDGRRFGFLRAGIQEPAKKNFLGLCGAKCELSRSAQPQGQLAAPGL